LVSKVYQIILAKSIRKDLEFIPKKHHSSIREAIETQLTHEPTLETTNRKPLTAPIQNATWELRCGEQNRYRVLYEVTKVDDEDAEIIEILGIVEVLAIGEKRFEKLLIQGREVKP
jgi:mRNA-degrading endonuclease RelE of RelBE toxin-antitoxin system